MAEEDFKLVFSPQLAKYLINMGHVVVDLKKKKEDNGTIFVFRKSDSLFRDIKDWTYHK